MVFSLGGRSARRLSKQRKLPFLGWFRADSISMPVVDLDGSSFLSVLDGFDGMAVGAEELEAFAIFLDEFDSNWASPAAFCSISFVDASDVIYLEGSWVGESAYFADRAHVVEDFFPSYPIVISDSLEDVGRCHRMQLSQV